MHTKSVHLTSIMVALTCLSILMIGCGTSEPDPSASAPQQPHLNEGPSIPEQGPQPDIEFDNLEYNFGKGNTNQIVKTKYAFRNVGEKTLMIEKVKAG